MFELHRGPRTSATLNHLAAFTTSSTLYRFLPRPAAFYAAAAVDMPSATPAKRVLADTTSNRANVQAPPRSAKRARFDAPNEKTRKPPALNANGSFNSSQPKSQF